MALSSQLHLVFLPLDDETFGFFEDLPAPLARLFCCNCPHLGPNNNAGLYRRPLRDSKYLVVFKEAPMLSPRLPTRSSALPTGHRCQHDPMGGFPLCCRTTAPGKEQSPFTGGPFDALAFLMAFAYEGVIKSPCCRRRNLMTRRRTIGSCVSSIMSFVGVLYDSGVEEQIFFLKALFPGLFFG